MLFSTLTSRFRRLSGLHPKTDVTVFMSDNERIALETAILQLAGPVRGLEWGSGASTAHFARLLPAKSSWLSIEHQADWYKKVGLMLDHHDLGFVQLHLVEPNTPHLEGSGDGDKRTFYNYVHFPEGAEELFNFVLVDGRARCACGQLAWTLLSDDGVLALHDAQREQYNTLHLPDAWRIRLQDPRRQVDGGHIELHLFLKNAAEELADKIRRRISPVVKVDVDPPRDQV